MPVKKKTTDALSIEERIQAIGEEESPLCMLVYGKSGTGKTVFSSSFPKPLLVIDVQERGTETIAGITGIDVIRIEDWDSFENTYWYLDATGYQKYKTVVIDQISQLQALRMAKLRIDSQMQPSDTFNKRDWGQVSGDLQTWLLNYRNLRNRGVNTCFIAHERSNEGSDTAEADQIDPSIGPRVMPSVAGFVNGAVSQIGSTFIRETFDAEKKRTVQYCMRLGPHAYYITKVRKPIQADLVIPDIVVNPTYEKILAISRGVKLAPKKALKKGDANAEANAKP